MLEMGCAGTVQIESGSLTSCIAHANTVAPLVVVELVMCNNVQLQPQQHSFSERLRLDTSNTCVGCSLGIGCGLMWANSFNKSENKAYVEQRIRVLHRCTMLPAMRCLWAHLVLWHGKCNVLAEWFASNVIFTQRLQHQNPPCTQCTCHTNGWCKLSTCTIYTRYRVPYPRLLRKSFQITLTKRTPVSSLTPRMSWCWPISA